MRVGCIVHVYVRTCMHVCMCVHTCTSVHVSTFTHVSVHARELVSPSLLLNSHA